MARLPYLDPADAQPEVAKVLDRVPPLGIFRMVANAQGAFPGFMRFGAAILDGREFDDLLRELAILRVARLTSGAEYEWVQHVAIATFAGAREDQIAAIDRGDVEADCFSAEERLVLRFTTQVVHDATADDETFAAMAARFTPREIVHLVLTIGQYMMIARVMAVSQIDLDVAAGAEALGATRREPRP